MTVHTPHPLVIEHGLVDGCDRCAEIAQDPFNHLDAQNLRDLMQRTKQFQKDEISPRSENEWIAMRQMEVALNHARIIRELEVFDGN
jgi:ribosome-binding protein aMBF1 (putative translation factor)